MTSSHHLTSPLSPMSPLRVKGVRYQPQIAGKSGKAGLDKDGAAAVNAAVDTSIRLDLIATVEDLERQLEFVRDEKNNLRRRLESRASTTNRSASPLRQSFQSSSSPSSRVSLIKVRSSMVTDPEHAAAQIDKYEELVTRLQAQLEETRRQKEIGGRELSKTRASLARTTAELKETKSTMHTLQRRQVIQSPQRGDRDPKKDPHGYEEIRLERNALRHDNDNLRLEIDRLTKRSLQSEERAHAMAEQAAEAHKEQRLAQRKVHEVIQATREEQTRPPPRGGIFPESQSPSSRPNMVEQSMLSFALERDHFPRATGLGEGLGSTSGFLGRGSMSPKLEVALQTAENMGLDRSELALQRRLADETKRSQDLTRRLKEAMNESEALRRTIHEHGIDVDVCGRGTASKKNRNMNKSGIVKGRRAWGSPPPSAPRHRARSASPGRFRGGNATEGSPGASRSNSPSPFKSLRQLPSQTPPPRQHAQDGSITSHVRARSGSPGPSVSGKEVSLRMELLRTETALENERQRSADLERNYEAATRDVQEFGEQIALMQTRLLALSHTESGIASGTGAGSDRVMRPSRSGSVSPSPPPVSYIAEDATASTSPVVPSSVLSTTTSPLQDAKSLMKTCQKLEATVATYKEENERLVKLSASLEARCKDQTLTIHRLTGSLTALRKANVALEEAVEGASDLMYAHEEQQHQNNHTQEELQKQPSVSTRRPLPRPLDTSAFEVPSNHKVRGTDTVSLGSSINPNASFWLGLDASETGTGLGVTQDISEFRHSIASLVETSARGRAGDHSRETTGLESPSRRINPDVAVLGKALDLCTDNEERFKMLSSRLRHIG